MTGNLLLTFNAGSSTVKIGLFDIDASVPRRLAKGVIDFRTVPLRFRLAEGPSLYEMDLASEASADLSKVLAETFQSLAQHFDMARIAAVGHRVVHGGDAFSGPVLIDDETVRMIENLTILAP